jgi:hypothetical protein
VAPSFIKHESSIYGKSSFPDLFLAFSYVVDNASMFLLLMYASSFDCKFTFEKTKPIL